MSDNARAHLAAILTRAAILEAARQRAFRRGDKAAAIACERELQALHHAYQVAAEASQLTPLGARQR